MQSVDLVLLLLFAYCIGRFLYSRLSLRIAAGLRGLFKSYTLLLLLLIVLSVLSLRLDYYSLFDVSFLKQPVIYSLSKLTQLVAVICGFFWLANHFMIRRPLLLKAMNVYWVTGIACSLYALFCYLLLGVTHYVPAKDIPLLAAYYSTGLRARGFFNEGGPFGIYLVSVFIIGFLRRHVARQPLGRFNLTVLTAAFLLSRSKAGFFAATLLLLYAVLLAASLLKKITYFVLAVVVLSATAMVFNFGEQVAGYVYSFENINQQVAERGVDLNLVAGRVSALYIVPKMIAAHPITGIGFGNYPLMRNDPRYLGVLPSIRQVEDVPGIGFPGIAAEMGIPATVWLLVLLSLPAWRCRKKAAILGIAAIYQLLAHTFAVQLTFFYPWFVSACALAALRWESGSSPLRDTASRPVRAAA